MVAPAMPDDEFRALQRVVEGMAVPCRRVFILHRVHGLSVAAIAAEMELSAAIVEEHLRRALALLVGAAGGEGTACENEDARKLDQAAAHVARQIDDPQDRARGEREAWLNADPGHAIAHARMLEAWDRAASLGRAAPAPDHDVAGRAGGDFPAGGQDQQ